MHHSEIVFNINTKEKIIIQLNEPLAVVHCCYQASIILLHNKKKTILSNVDIQDNMVAFSALLTKALNSALILHDSITKDIGYLYNDYCDLLWHEDSCVKSNFVYRKLASRD